jgi:hypothetical protein
LAILRTILTLSLAMLVVFSSMGMTITRHLCAGEVKMLTVFSHSATCEMEQQKEKLPPCHKSPTKDDCCQDQTIALEVEDQKTVSNFVFKFSAPDITFIAAFSAVWTSLFNLYSSVHAYVPDYSPPVLAQDIPVLVQSFLL